MQEQVLLENLTEDGVDLCIISGEEENPNRFRVCLRNTLEERSKLLNFLEPHPDKLQAVLEVWGELPLVFDEELPHEALPTDIPVPAPTENELALMEVIAQQYEELQALKEQDLQNKEAITEIYEMVLEGLA